MALEDLKGQKCAQVSELLFMKANSNTQNSINCLFRYTENINNFMIPPLRFLYTKTTFTPLQQFPYTANCLKEVLPTTPFQLSGKFVLPLLRNVNKVSPQAAMLKLIFTACNRQYRSTLWRPMHISFVNNFSSVCILFCALQFISFSPRVGHLYQFPCR